MKLIKLVIYCTTVTTNKFVWTLGLTRFLFLCVWDSPWNFVLLTLFSTGLVGHDITIFSVRVLCTVHLAADGTYSGQKPPCPVMTAPLQNPPQPSGTQLALDVLQTGQVAHTNPRQSTDTHTHTRTFKHRKKSAQIGGSCQTNICEIVIFHRKTQVMQTHTEKDSYLCTITVKTHHDHDSATPLKSDPDTQSRARSQTMCACKLGDVCRNVLYKNPQLLPLETDHITLFCNMLIRVK